MFDDLIEAVEVTAAEARDHMSELETERAMAVQTGVAEIDAYMRDLEDEIETWRRLYVLSALSEIATLRGELSGRLQG
jgi:polyhydroxyalkanoate synthesis regulator phasin